MYFCERAQNFKMSKSECPKGNMYPHILWSVKEIIKTKQKLSTLWKSNLQVWQISLDLENNFIAFHLAWTCNSQCIFFFWSHRKSIHSTIKTNSWYLCMAFIYVLMLISIQQQSICLFSHIFKISDLKYCISQIMSLI